jgi:uncharacterized membrane protein (DUF106 family)
MNSFLLGMVTFVLLLILYFSLPSIYYNLTNWYQVRKTLENIEPIQRKIEKIKTEGGDLRSIEILHEEREHLRNAGGRLKNLQIFDTGMIVARGGAQEYAIILIPSFEGNSVSWHAVCGSDYMVPGSCSE